MPVKWIYVLQDGTLAPATLGTSGSVAHVLLASSTNPIVGRIAFWTDDETCKVKHQYGFGRDILGRAEGKQYGGTRLL